MPRLDQQAVKYIRQPFSRVQNVGTRGSDMLAAIACAFLIVSWRMAVNLV